MYIAVESVEINISNFIERKRLMIEKLKQAKSNKEVDLEIIPHIDIMNSWKIVFTTSSCSGRIALIDAPFVGPKKESIKVARWHREVDVDVVLNAIRNYIPRNILWLKYDSFILAFSVASFEWARFFLKLARYVNLKDSGIRSINPDAGYINMDFMSTEKLAVPVRVKDKIIIEKESLRNIIKIANCLMAKNKLKLNMLYNILLRLDSWIKENGFENTPALVLFDDLIAEYKQKLSTIKNRLKCNKLSSAW